MGLLEKRGRRTAAEIAQQLGQRIDTLVPRLLPNAVKQSGYWRVGSIDGEKGKSLYICSTGSRAGRWVDAATDDRGDALDLVARCKKTSIADAYHWALMELHGEAHSQRKEETSNDQKLKIDYAWQTWTEARSIEGTPAETYLRGRGITCDIPVVLAYHRKCPRGRGERHPALVALLLDQDTNEFCGIHRTFIKPDGSGKVEDGIPKMMLGRARHAAIKLDPSADVSRGLGICEGIETALSIKSMGWDKVWAVGSAGNIRSFPVLDDVHDLTVFADNDVSEVGVESARQCVQRWRDAGRESKIICPNDPGTDWNDVLRRAK